MTGGGSSAALNDAACKCVRVPACYLALQATDFTALKKISAYSAIVQFMRYWGVYPSALTYDNIKANYK